MKKNKKIIHEKSKSLIEKTIKPPKRVKRKSSFDFLNDTYKFIENIAKKMNEINKIKENQIEGILISENSTIKNFKNEKNSIQSDSLNKLSDDEQECYIVDQEKYDLNLMNYKSENLKVQNFNCEIDCIICFKPIKNIFPTNCLHKLCFKCGNKWEKINKSCPVCRKKL